MKKVSVLEDVELTASTNVPIQDNWRRMSVGHQIFDIHSMFTEMTRERRRRGFFERVHDFIKYHVFRDIGCKWPEFKRGCKNLWYWIPTVWQDRDWDQAYLNKIIQAKLRKVMAYRRNPKSNYMAHVGDEKVYNAMLQMAELLKRINDDEYSVRGARDSELGERPCEVWHTPFKDLQISPFKNSWDYEKYMQEQDLARFCELFKKNYYKLWD